MDQSSGKGVRGGWGKGGYSPINVKANSPLDTTKLSRSLVHAESTQKFQMRNIKKTVRSGKSAAQLAKARLDSSRWSGLRGTTILNQMVKKAIMRKFETKMHLIAYQNINLYHDSGTVAGGTAVAVDANLLRTNVGTTQFTRIGDKVRSMSLEFRLWLSNKLDRPNVMYRVLVLSADNEDIPSGTQVTDLFFPHSTGNKMVGQINTDKFRVHKDLIVQPFAGDYSLELNATNKEHSRLVKFNVSTNKDLVYKTDGSTVPSGRNNYALFVFPYDAWGTLNTDNIASFAVTITHRFKDV